MSDFDVLSLLDQVHEAERSYYQLYFLQDGSREARISLDLARLETRHLEDEFYRAVCAGRSGDVTLF